MSYPSLLPLLPVSSDHGFLAGRRGGVRRWDGRRAGAVLALVGGLIFVPSSHATESFASAGQAAHAMLGRLCDEFGGRMTGSTANREAMEKLAMELRTLGLEPEFSRFKMPGWQRGDDRVELIAPLRRRLRVAALAYTQPQAPVEAGVVAIGAGQPADFPPDARGKVALLSASSGLTSREIAQAAVAHGLRGVLLINREGGGQLLARTGSFIGEPLPLPIFSVAQEEGLWIERLLQRGEPVRLRLETNSRCREVETANLVLQMKGRSAERVIVGAHFDSWDLGQGAVDNGIGVAQLFALASALRGRDLPRTVELVWFNGEEEGLWGSRHEAAQLAGVPVVAMINLDMVGVPVAVNALGDATLVPVLQRWNESRGARKLPLGVQNINWFGSDHTPYQLAGIHTLTFHGPLPRETARCYHDFSDTIDKLPEKIVVDSAETLGELVLALADETSVPATRRASPDETERLFTAFGLERRMKAIGYWPFH